MTKSPTNLLNNNSPTNTNTAAAAAAAATTATAPTIGTGGFTSYSPTIHRIIPKPIALFRNTPTARTTTLAAGGDHKTKMKTIEERTTQQHNHSKSSSSTSENTFDCYSYDEAMAITRKKARIRYEKNREQHPDYKERVSKSLERQREKYHAKKKALKAKQQALRYQEQTNSTHFNKTEEAVVPSSSSSATRPKTTSSSCNYSDNVVKPSIIIRQAKTTEESTKLRPHPPSLPPPPSTRQRIQNSPSQMTANKAAVSLSVASTSQMSKFPTDGNTDVVKTSESQGASTKATCRVKPHHPVLPPPHLKQKPPSIHPTPLEQNIKHDRTIQVNTRKHGDRNELPSSPSKGINSNSSSPSADTEKPLKQTMSSSKFGVSASPTNATAAETQNQSANLHNGIKDEAAWYKQRLQETRNVALSWKQQQQQQKEGSMNDNNIGTWSSDEHKQFLIGYQKYGKNWEKISKLIRTRTTVQVRTHSQKYFQKIIKDDGDFLVTKKENPFATKPQQQHRVPTQSLGGFVSSPSQDFPLTIGSVQKPPPMGPPTELQPQLGLNPKQPPAPPAWTSGDGKIDGELRNQQHDFVARPATNGTKLAEKQTQSGTMDMIGGCSETGIFFYHDHDVLSGRGNHANHHPGNQFLREIVRKFKVEYVKSLKPQRGKFAQMIVDVIKSQKPPGRFLKQDTTTNLWYKIGDRKAIDKVRQALREGAPELLKDVDHDENAEDIGEVYKEEHAVDASGADAVEGNDDGCDDGGDDDDDDDDDDDRSLEEIFRNAYSHDAASSATSTTGRLMVSKNSFTRITSTSSKVNGDIPAVASTVSKDSSNLLSKNSFGSPHGSANKEEKTMMKSQPEKTRSKNENQTVAPKLGLQFTQWTTTDDENEDSTTHDVYFGRGGEANQKRLGSLYRNLVRHYFKDYRKLDQIKKRNFAEFFIIEPIQKKGGKFFVRNESNDSWVIANPKLRADKVMQALRDAYKESPLNHPERSKCPSKKQQKASKQPQKENPKKRKEMQAKFDIPRRTSPSEHDGDDPPNKKARSGGESSSTGGIPSRDDSLINNPWQKMYQELVLFKNQYGHCAVPNSFNTYPLLRVWVDDQCRQFMLRLRTGSSEMTDYQHAALEQIGFFNKQYFSERWDERLRELKVFKDTAGHCDVPINKDHQQLAHWVRYQQKQMKLLADGKPSSLTPDRIVELEMIGFNWEDKFGNSSDYDAIWDERLKELQAYKASTGHCDVPNDYSSNSRLSNWVRKQRYQKKLLLNGKPSSLTKYRASELDKLGFLWVRPKKNKIDASQVSNPDTLETGKENKFDKEWAERLKELKVYKEDNGHCNVATTNPLASWVKRQRVLYNLLLDGKPSSITPYRIAELEKLGFDWDPRGIKKSKKEEVTKSSIDKKSLAAEASSSMYYPYKVYNYHTPGRGEDAYDECATKIPNDSVLQRPIISSCNFLEILNSYRNYPPKLDIFPSKATPSSSSSSSSSSPSSSPPFSPSPSPPAAAKNKIISDEVNVMEKDISSRSLVRKNIVEEVKVMEKDILSRSWVRKDIVEQKDICFGGKTTTTTTTTENHAPPNQKVNRKYQKKSDTDSNSHDGVEILNSYAASQTTQSLPADASSKEAATNLNVFLGRGGRANKFRQDSLYRKLILKNWESYQHLRPEEKRRFAEMKVMRPIEDAGGKFFINVGTKTGGPRWVVGVRQEVGEKVMQALRDCNKDKRKNAKWIT